MISIYSKSYNQEEKQALNDMINELNIMFNECYCPQYKDGYKDYDCRLCEYRHLCYDIEKITQHSEEILK